MMPPLSKQLENWLKPLRLEEKQGFTNRSVVGGLDRFLMKQCDEILKGPTAGKGDFPVFLKGLRTSFSQYMTYGPEERRKLVARTQEQLKDWIQKLPAESVPAPAAKGSLSDS